jgi:hypothetical protein
MMEESFFLPSREPTAGPNSVLLMLQTAASGRIKQKTVLGLWCLSFGIHMRP